MNTQENAVEKYLLEHIPISKAMGIEVDTVSHDKVVLKAPFANNINHKKTVFGGSLHAVAALACWTFVHYHISPLADNYQIVITRSEVEYLAPVASDFKAECHLPNVEEWNKFLHTLQKRGKARITLHAKIYQGETLCVDFTGVFAALKSND